MRADLLYYYPDEYKEFLIEFHSTRDYFECHEILEEYWLEQNREKKWLTLIQLAVAVYHERQKNFKGSMRLYKKVLKHMENESGLLEDLSIDEDTLISLIHKRMYNIQVNGDYSPMNLPLTDRSLQKECRQTAENRRCTWNYDDRAADENLIYKHRHRDRSEVIEARRKALVEKQLTRNL
ncbi:DUF309 domain-containing protein [Alkalicoccus halolimnae]|uniref:DUF309 domain-containing protein n=1 Tax=Alkalicoccus halolimnae TaxID=1667239 RepID=A0AAJ8LXZ8_9BACI|nr:DUF309 domain-containing protein [Alkalicoccus halolimnae]